MCGIAGLLHLDGERAACAGTLRRMADRIAHRGPDDEGFFVSGPVGLAHRRLSIIDLSGGHQPMSSEDGSITVVFNGEIYNHRELRPALIARGHCYRTSCDTETILHAYEEYGEACVEKFRGMFSFVIWDEGRRKLFAVRDRLGIKPFYYSVDDGVFVFGSEIKAMEPALPRPFRLREQNLAEYFQTGYVSGDETMFEGIRKLPPGHVLTVTDGMVRVREYWDLPLDEPMIDDDEDTIVRRFRELLDESVELRLMSDVPLGSFLSGGVDSSAIAATAAMRIGPGLQTFCMGFDSGLSLDENVYAVQVSERYRTDHHRVSLTPQAFWEAAKECIWHMDEPISDSPSISLLALSRAARQHCTVLLSGEGADELLAGYSIYRRLLRIERLRQLTGLDRVGGARHIGARLGTYGWMATAPLPNKYWGVKGLIRKSPQRGLLSQEYWGEHVNREVPAEVRRLYDRAAGQDLLHRMLYLDLKSWLPHNLLTRADKMTMAASIELRVPFLDHRLVEFAFRVPSHMKIRNGTSKYLARAAFAPMLPESVMTRAKVGFQTPVEAWFRDDWLESIRALASDARARGRSFFDFAAIESAIRDHEQRTHNRTEVLWTFLSFEMWYRLYIEKSLQA